MNENDDRFRDILGREYRPEPQSHVGADDFKRAVNRRVRHSIVMRISACLVLIGVLGTASWQTWFVDDGVEIRTPMAASGEAGKTVSKQRGEEPENWVDALQTAWLEMNELVSFDDTAFLDENNDDVGLELPDSMMVIAGIVDLTDGKDPYP